MAQRFFIRKSYAVSSVISLVLTVSIMISASSAIFYWGSSYLDGKKTDVALDQVNTQFSEIADSLEGIRNSGQWSSRQVPVDTGDGSITVDSEGDRMVVSYSLSDEYNVFPKYLDDDDEHFALNLYTGSTDLLYARLYRFSDQSTSREFGTPVSGEIINYTNVKYDWTGGDEYTYILENHSSQWSQFSSDPSACFRNVADGLSYTFHANDSTGSSVYDTRFHVIEGMNENETILGNPPEEGLSDWNFYSNSPLTDVVRIDLYDEQGYLDEPGAETTTGDIETVTDGDSLEHVDLLHVTDNVYAYVASEDRSASVVTCEVARNGTILSALIDSYEFDDGESSDRDASMIHVDGDIYAIAYCGSDGSQNGSLITLEISSNGTIQGVKSRLEFSNTLISSPNMVMMNSATELIMIYQDDALKGNLSTFKITNAGESISFLDSEIIENEICCTPQILQIGSRSYEEIYLIVYETTDNEGKIQTVKIRSISNYAGEPGDIKQLYQNWIFESDVAHTPQCIHIGESNYAFIYRGQGNAGYIKTISIAWWGMIYRSIIDSYVFDTQRCFNPQVVNMVSMYYKIAYSGHNNASLISVRIYSDGTIQKEVLDWHEFHSSSCEHPSLVRIDADVFLIGYYVDSTKKGIIETAVVEYTDLFENPIVRIFLFDFGRITYSYPTSSGTSRTVFENNGVVSDSQTRKVMQREPDVVFDIESLPQTSTDTWSKYRRDNYNTGVTSTAGPLEENLIWSVDLDGSASPLEYGEDTGVYKEGSGPTVAYGNVYAATSLGVFCLDATYGTIFWSNTDQDELDSFRHCSPAIHDGKVFVVGASQSPGGSSSLYCLDAFTGSVQWELSEGPEYGSSPVVYQDRVYYCAGGTEVGDIYCTDLSGNLLYNAGGWWPYGYNPTSPAVYDDKIYVNAASGFVFCYDLNLNEVLTRKYHGWGVCCPVIRNGNIYVGRYHPSPYTITCIDADDFSTKGSISLSAQIDSTAAVTEDTLYVGTVGSQQLYSIDIATMTENWNVALADETHSSPIVANGYIYIGDDSGKIYCFDSSGVEQWSYQTSAAIRSSPAVYDGRLYVMNNNAVLYCFDVGASSSEIDPPYLLLDIGVIHPKEGSVSLSGSGVIQMSLIEEYIREKLRLVENLKISFYGDHADSWLSYFQNTHSFDLMAADREGATVVPPDINNPQVWLSIRQSLHLVSLS